MLFRPFRDLIIAIAFLGTSWAALGQSGSLVNTKAPNSGNFAYQNTEYVDPASFQETVSQALSDLIAYESAVLIELRRGFDRLGKSCVSSSAPKPNADSVLLSRNTLAMEQALAAVQARQDALARSAPTFEQAANRLVAQQCTGLSSGWGLELFKSASCRQAQQLQGVTKTYRTEFDRYYQLQAERYKTYLDFVQIERQGCVRAGFSSRLLQANDAHMRDSEEHTQRLLNQWSRDLSRYLGMGASGAAP